MKKLNFRNASPISEISEPYCIQADQVKFGWSLNNFGQLKLVCLEGQILACLVRLGLGGLWT